MDILKSASKIVFILMAAVVSAAFLWEVVSGKVTLDPKDFIALASMAFAFYFANKGEASAPYAGK